VRVVVGAGARLLVGGRSRAAARTAAMAGFSLKSVKDAEHLLAVGCIGAAVAAE
jgi:hypothetical protein